MLQLILGFLVWYAAVIAAAMAISWATRELRFRAARRQVQRDFARSLERTKIAIGAELLPSLTFLAQRLEEEVPHAPRSLKAAAEPRTGPSGTTRVGRVSERDGRRGPGGVAATASGLGSGGAIAATTPNGSALRVGSAAERARPEGGTSASTFPAEDGDRGRYATGS